MVTRLQAGLCRLLARTDEQCSVNLNFPSNIYLIITGHAEGEGLGTRNLGGPFLEGLGNFSGSKSNIQNEI